MLWIPVPSIRCCLRRLHYQYLVRRLWGESLCIRWWLPPQAVHLTLWIHHRQRVLLHQHSHPGPGQKRWGTLYPHWTQRGQDIHELDLKCHHLFVSLFQLFCIIPFLTQKQIKSLRHPSSTSRSNATLLYLFLIVHTHNNSIRPISWTFARWKSLCASSPWRLNRGQWWASVLGQGPCSPRCQCRAKRMSCRNRNRYWEEEEGGFAVSFKTGTSSFSPLESMSLTHLRSPQAMKGTMVRFERPRESVGAISNCKTDFGIR